ncbi:uncharacterized protein EI90DRAFT_925331 [Cantharellus anzutake]|uniref:uncharacterized protein n=1 Tax=Cantharellus anzutake TaxID=1750568 RepID=UPI0019035B31|nr:uncharacterized protein EI90DRAFT_925331 [Cantharellus anzutake]KAF8332100.1 hypothetical protein EI90DRAFT_925331 [Cantharellus anzutake]
MGYGVDSGDVSFAFDFNGPWNAPSASGSGAGTYSFDDQRQVSGASVSGAVAGVGEVEGTQFLGNLPGSFGQSPLGTFDFQFGGERTVSDEARGRTISGPQQTSSSNPSPARSRDPSSSYQTSNRNYTGPIDKQVAQPSTPADEAHEGRGRSSSDSSRNYTGPIDLFAFQAHLQEERNFSGASSSAETYHTAHGGSDRNRPYTPPSGASNASRRVGGSWKPSKPQVRNTSAATSSSGGARTTAQSLVDGNNIWEEFDFSSIPASSSSRTTSAVSSRQ